MINVISDDKFTVNKYRPYLFCHFSQQRFTYNRLLHYLNLHNILVGFREAHSTSMALMRMVNDISK